MQSSCENENWQFLLSFFDNFRVPWDKNSPLLCRSFWHLQHRKGIKCKLSNSRKFRGIFSRSLTQIGLRLQRARLARKMQFLITTVLINLKMLFLVSFFWYALCLSLKFATKTVLETVLSAVLATVSKWSSNVRLLSEGHSFKALPFALCEKITWLPVLENALFERVHFAYRRFRAVCWREGRGEREKRGERERRWEGRKG